MISYKSDVLDRKSLSEVKMGRGFPICERVRKKSASLMVWGSIQYGQLACFGRHYEC